jgi:hypothetical protein
MQRGRFLNLAALALAAGVTQAAYAAAPAAPTAAAPVGIFTGDAALSDGAHVGSGSITVSGSGASAVYTVTTTGFDLGGNKDRGYFAYTNLPGDGGITARVLTQTGGSTGGWMKNGVMIRSSTDSASVMAEISYTGLGKNHNPPDIESIIRTKANSAPVGASFHRDLKTGPVWLRAQRQGTTVQTLSSDNGKDWKLVDSQTLAIKATDPVLAGLGSSSQSDTVAEMGTLDDVTISSDIIQPNPPAGPSQVVAQPGNGAVLLTFNTLPGASYNIYRQEAGSKTAPALLNQQPTANGWFIDTGVTNGTNYLYTVTTVTKSLADPTKSLEGTPSAPVLAEPQVPILPGTTLNYLTTTATPATLDLTGGVLTIKAQGSDIWSTTQNGIFLATPVSGDYSMNAKVLEQPLAIAPNKSTNVKVGPMIADSPSNPSQYAFVFATSGRSPNAVLFEGQTNVPAGKNFSDAGTKTADTKYPLWLKLSKAGSMISAFQSNDGTTWTQVGTAHDYGELLPTTYTGIGMSSGDAKNFGSAKLDAASIQVGPVYTPPAPAKP